MMSPDMGASSASKPSETPVLEASTVSNAEIYAQLTKQVDFLAMDGEKCDHFSLPTLAFILKDTLTLFLTFEAIIRFPNHEMSKTGVSYFLDAAGPTRDGYTSFRIVPRDEGFQQHWPIGQPYTVQEADNRFHCLLQVYLMILTGSL